MSIAVDHLIRVLAEGGVDYVFGVPGGGTVMLYTAMHDVDCPRPILTRQEHGAAVMADAYARASGRPAAIMGQGAFIVANGAFGLMEALTSSSPVIVIGDTSDQGVSPHPVGQVVTGDHGSPDVLSMLRSMTKYAALATTGKEAVLSLELAIKHAMTGDPGPTALLMRSNAISAEVDEEAAPRIYRGGHHVVQDRRTPVPDDIAAAVEMLASGRSVILAGKGVHNACAHTELRELAELWGSPVATTYKGKSAIEEHHPLSLGMAGTFGLPSANSVLQDADVVLVVGAKARSNDTAGETLIDVGRQRVIQVDISPLNASWAFPAELNLIGDARAVLRLLIDASRDRAPDSQAVRDVEHEVANLRANDAVLNDPAAQMDTTPVMPQRLARLLEENLDPRSNICLDAGNNRVWMGWFHRAQRPHSFFSPGGLAGMGWALPAAIGVKVARPEEPAVAVAGDGGFMMSIQSLATAVEFDFPVVSVIFNDSSLGMVRQHQEDKVTASVFGKTDYAAIARGFGADGYNVDHGKDLPGAIRMAQASKRTVVIDVTIDDQPAPDVFRARPRQMTET